MQVSDPAESIPSGNQEVKFSPSHFKRQANCLTFRVQNDANECKVYLSAGEIVICNFWPVALERNDRQIKTAGSTELQGQLQIYIGFLRAWLSDWLWTMRGSRIHLVKNEAWDEQFSCSGLPANKLSFHRVTSGDAKKTC